MTKPKQATLSPLVRAQQFLESHDELHDIRLYALLLFNAFDETMRMYLAWRLGCSEDALPGAAKNNSSLLFDFALAGLAEERKHAKLFAEARNAVAHQFHDGTYVTKLEAFVKAITKKTWPARKSEQLRSLAFAVWKLSVNVTIELEQLPARPDAPFPEIPHKLRFGR